MPVDTDLVRGERALNVDVGEEPIVGFGGTGELHAEAVTYRAVSAVAAY